MQALPPILLEGGWWKEEGRETSSWGWAGGESVIMLTSLVGFKASYINASTLMFAMMTIW